MAEGVSIFIDGANFFFALIAHGLDPHLNFNKLANKLCGGRGLRRIYYYDAAIPPEMDSERSKKQQGFFKSLDYLDYFEKRFGHMQQKTAHCSKCKSDYFVWVQKGVDVRLGVDLTAFAARGFYATGIVVSGDGDLVHAINSAKDFGAHIELAYFDDRSRKLQTACDRFVALTRDYLSDCY
jgi:uncharacterized LabA/DUF88 family protein